MISVIVPAYNAEKTLERCVCSILAQTLSELQIIIINDGSEDLTGRVCEQLASLDNRIEVYQIENKGSVAARKLGLEKAVGDYIGFVDADDYIDPDMFYVLQEKLRKSDADFVHSGHIEEKQGKQNVICNFEDKIVELDDLQCKLIFLKKYVFEGDIQNISQSVCTKLYKSEFIKKCFEKLPDSQQHGEDLLCLLRCVFESHRIILCKKAMYHYVVNESSLSHTVCDVYMMNIIGMCYYLINELEEYQCLEVVKESFYHFLKRQILYTILKTGCESKRLPQFYLKDIEDFIGKQLVIFGAGNVGQDYYTQISRYTGCKIAAWIDSKWDTYNFEYAEVIGVKDINKVIFDTVILAVNDENIGMEMRALLIEMGIEEKKYCGKNQEDIFKKYISRKF